MRVETTTKIQTKEVIINTYIADNGKEFDNARQCELYEIGLKKQKLKNRLARIQTNKELDRFVPVDGGEYYTENNYRWYLPKTQDEVDTINEYYNIEYPIIPDEIGDWVCVETYDIDDPTNSTCAIPIKESVMYVKKLFGVLGYDVTISKRKEV